MPWVEEIVVGEKTHTQRSALRECAQQCVHATEGWVERDFQIDLHIHSLLKQNRLRIRVTRARWWAFSNPTLRDHPPHHTDGHSSREPEPHPDAVLGAKASARGTQNSWGSRKATGPWRDGASSHRTRGARCFPRGKTGETLSCPLTEHQKTKVLMTVLMCNSEEILRTERRGCDSQTPSILVHLFI